jgi:ribosomal protein S18 acetylase RimI-like enzyme
MSLELLRVRRSDFVPISYLWLESALHHAETDPRFAPRPNARQQYIQYLMSVFDRKDHLLRLVRQRHTVVGFCVTAVQPPSPIFQRDATGFLSDLAVSKEARRSGIGSALVRDAVAWLREQGATSSQITVSVYNELGQKFWREHMGFQPYMDKLWLDL